MRQAWRRSAVVVTVAGLLFMAAGSAGGEEVRTPVRAYREANEARIVGELAELLALPNVATDDANIRRNAARIVQLLEKRGVSARLLESPAGGPPAIYGELRVPHAARTVVLYAHYDGQPVVPADWAGDPWKPVLRRGGIDGASVALPRAGEHVDPELRLYGRSASDDKAPIIGFLAALDALRAAGIEPSVNLKFFFEGEEEQGSQHLGALLEEHAALLTADGWIFCDGPRHSSGSVQVVFGARGVVGLTMTTYGASRPLHSGHYGNWAPNPIARLVALLASMRDGDGNILIDGFYDDVVAPSQAEGDAIAALPNDDETLRRSLAIKQPEGGGERLPERLLLPAVNFTGIRAGTVGAGAVNAIQSEASASMDVRIVPHQTPARIRELIEAHAKKQGFTVIHEEPSAEERLANAKLLRIVWSDGYASVRTPLDAPFSRAVIAAVKEGSGGKPLIVPTFGGSLPLDLFEKNLGAPLAIVPIANFDNNQHAANENLRIGNLWDGIEIYATIMARLGALWTTNP
jgi:acetylornithine deacetylase/succinyl-diaminopimelate desuccinylase-like protein